MKYRLRVRHGALSTKSQSLDARWSFRCGEMGGKITPSGGTLGEQSLGGSTLPPIGEMQPPGGPVACVRACPGNQRQEGIGLAPAVADTSPGHWPWPLLLPLTGMCCGLRSFHLSRIIYLITHNVHPIPFPQPHPEPVGTVLRWELFQSNLGVNLN